MSEALVVGRLETGRGGFRGGPYDLHLEPGEASQLVGENGCGKSTLLETLAGLVPAFGGTVRLGDTTWEGPGVPTVAPWRRGVGVLLQALGLWPHLTVRGQAELAAPGAGERIDDLADRLAITALLDRRPARLSGGEAQRAALLRTLAPDPRVLLLDEPTSAQHDGTEALVRAVIRGELARGRIVVLASHRGWPGVRTVEMGSG